MDTKEKKSAAVGENAETQSGPVRKRRPAKVAGTREVLAYFTKVMRNDIEGEKVGIADSFRAAVLLAKHYSLFSDKKDVGQKDVVIVDNV